MANSGDNGFDEFDGIGVTYKNDFYLDNIKIDVIAPINSYSDTNSNSIVIKMSINSYSFLFTGDMTVNEENDIIKKNPDILNSDVLKVAHHGSNTSTQDEFLKLVNPKYSIVSVGKNNNYGLPNIEIIDKLSLISKVYLTKDNGNISFYIYKNKMWVLPYK